MNVFKRILDAIFPPNYTCHLCGREVFDGKPFCEDCKKTVDFNDGEVCPKCGRRVCQEGLCLECKEDAPLYTRAVSFLNYEGGSRNLIYAFKNGSPWLKEYFADMLSEKCSPFADAEAIVYVPMTPRAQRRRGYNQSQLLADALSKRMNIPVLRDAVIKIKQTKQQKSLNKRDREENLKGTFGVDRQAVEGKNLIIVDDVMTTGATVNAICAQLKKNGAGKLYVATAASVEDRPEKPNESN